MKKKKKNIEKIIITIILIIVATIGINYDNKKENINEVESYEISNLPEYNGNIYIILNDNIPEFSEEDMNIQEDYYSDLKNEKVRNSNNKNKLG